MTRICRTCNIEKDISEFNRNANHSSGVATYCKVCDKEYRDARNKRLKLAAIPPETQICRICNIEKPAKEFHKEMCMKTGIATRCIKCENEYASTKSTRVSKKRPPINIAIRNSQRMRSDYKKNTYEILRTKLYDYLLENNCIHCGEQNPVKLEFHHINPENKIANVAHLVAQKKSWDIIKTEIDKCVVLCANCHKVVTSVQQRWYINTLISSTLLLEPSISRPTIKDLWPCSLPLLRKEAEPLILTQEADSVNGLLKHVLSLPL